jgi:hypothetical protein
MKIKVLVMALNEHYKMDIYSHIVECDEANYAIGAHYKMAMDQSKKHGYEPKCAFDHNDPAFNKIKKSVV